MLSSVCFIFAATCPSSHLASMIEEQQAWCWALSMLLPGEMARALFPEWHHTEMTFLPLAFKPQHCFYCLFLWVCFSFAPFLPPDFKIETIPEVLAWNLFFFSAFSVRKLTTALPLPSILTSLRMIKLSSSNGLQTLITKCLLYISRTRYGAGLSVTRVLSHFSQFGAPWNHP